MIKNIKPMHPGKVLLEYYMEELNLTQTALSKLCQCHHRKINEIVNCKRSISPDFAITLEKIFGTTAEMWVRMQAEYDGSKVKSKVLLK